MINLKQKFANDLVSFFKQQQAYKVREMQVTSFNLKLS